MEPIPVLPATESPAPDSNSDAKPSLVRGLGLLDSVLLLVSGIIGSSIFLTAKDIAGPLPQPVLFLLVWVLGALISLCACFAFAELGSMFPDSGGQYIYLREAYGDLIAFLYGWMLFAVANGGTIAALSVASAAYLGQVFPVVSQDRIVVRDRGNRDDARAFARPAPDRGSDLRQRRRTPLGRAAAERFYLDEVHGDGRIRRPRIRHRQRKLVELSCARGQPHAWDSGRAQLISALGVGLIAVFWAYDGWVYITWVAGEVKDPRTQCTAGHGAGRARRRRDLHRDESDLHVRAAAEGNRRARNHRPRRRGRAVLSAAPRCGCR